VHIPSQNLTERHIRILDAAERIFARAGIHTATISDVAVEAAMSPGNLYRYFPSKEAIVAGLAERDRMAIAADFARLTEGPATLDLLEALGRRHLVDEPREKAMITLQIWAEASRNPAVATLCNSVQSEVYQGILAFVVKAKVNGELPPDLDDAQYIAATFMMVDGYMRCRATQPDFDAAAGAELLFRCMRVFGQTLLTPGSNSEKPETA
jgi:TetR/AcrR family transcriptional regulator, repressor for uid operon